MGRYKNIDIDRQENPLIQQQELAIAGLEMEEQTKNLTFNRDRDPEGRLNKIQKNQSLLMKLCNQCGELEPCYAEDKGSPWHEDVNNDSTVNVGSWCIYCYDAAIADI